MRADRSAEAGPEPNVVEQARSKHVREWAFNCGIMVIAAALLWLISTGDEHRPGVYNALIFLAFAVPIQGVFSYQAYRKDLRRARVRRPH